MAEVDTSRIKNLWSDKLKCSKCGRMRPATEFYKLKNGARYDVCRQCLTQYVDCKKPNTFLWILKELDIPFIESAWISVAKKAYMRDPQKFKSASVLGRYIRTMMTGDWRKMSWSDTVLANKDRGAASFLGGKTKEEVDAHNAEVKKQLDAGEISEAKYKMLLWSYQGDGDSGDDSIEDGVSNAIDEAINQAQDEKVAQMERDRKLEEAKKAEELEKLAGEKAEVNNRRDYLRKKDIHLTPPDEKKAPAKKKTKTKAEDKPEPQKIPKPIDSSTLGKPTADNLKQAAVDQAAQTPDFKAQMLAAIPDTAMEREKRYLDELTDDDMQMLALKWGDNYTPSEWVKMEDLYRKYASEYEMNIDREETLKKMCKTSLKMDNALDSEDTMAYSKLAQVFDQLRKSAKFTEAQNKDKEEAYVDSIGELVSAVERGGGIIPQFDYKFEATQDKVDLTLKDMKAYTYNLVKNEMGLGDLIESYIQKLEQDQKEDDGKFNFGHELKTGEEPDADEIAAEEFSRTLEDSIASEASNIFSQLED